MRRAGGGRASGPPFIVRAGRVYAPPAGPHTGGPRPRVEVRCSRASTLSVSILFAVLVVLVLATVIAFMMPDDNAAAAEAIRPPTTASGGEARDPLAGRAPVPERRLCEPDVMEFLAVPALVASPAVTGAHERTAWSASPWLCVAPLARARRPRRACYAFFLRGFFSLGGSDAA